MLKQWFFFTCLFFIAFSSCKDIPEVVYNQVPVTIRLSATSGDFEHLNIDFQKIMINNEMNTLDTVSTDFAGIIDMANWVTDKKIIGEFTVSYDSIQRIEFFIGNGNSMTANGENVDLPLLSGAGPSIVIPVNRYIQDQNAVELDLELNSSQSVVLQSPGNYALDPKLLLKN